MAKKNSNGYSMWTTKIIITIGTTFLINVIGGGQLGG